MVAAHDVPSSRQTWTPIAPAPHSNVKRYHSAGFQAIGTLRLCSLSQPPSSAQPRRQMSLIEPPSPLRFSMCIFQTWLRKAMKSLKVLPSPIENHFWSTFMGGVDRSTFVTSNSTRQSEQVGML